MLRFDNIYCEFSKKFNLKKNDLIFPLFVDENNNFQELSYLPGIFKISSDKIIRIVDEIVDNGIHSLILFGIPRLRDNRGQSSFSKNGVVQKSLQLIKSNFGNKIKILSFSAKQSSSLYKPFRSETFFDTSANEIDKSTYQVSYNNPRQIHREIEMDIYEGADMVMIKPAISSLDLVYRIKKLCKIPIVVQIVSGEYSMIKAASKVGFIDETYFILNLIYSLKRAGVDKIISYSSSNISKYLL